MRYSTDGRFVAFFYYPADDKVRRGRIRSAGLKKFLNRCHGLRVVSMDDAHEVRDVGVFEYVGRGRIRITALPGGGFLISGKGIAGKDDDSLADTYTRLGARGLLDLMKWILVKYHPSTNKVEMIGGASWPKGVWWLEGGIDPERMVGVVTDSALRTRVLDLRARKVLLTVDNSHNRSYHRFVGR